ncbi:RNA polymerase sigma factor [Paraflavitalea pollutisoli]|uniref:RNA polymerase sigma factor n=1 Tax=Paraflavitalea pollutisoli TaxID=3034143 RepID=UPI0023ED7B33|nr:RNA polymerase sigma factor [Paraflavitalea sp. H1-2-19X]
MLTNRDDIIEGCKKQDPKSQEALYKTCYTGMIKLCTRYARDADEAASLFNEGMLKVFNTLHQYQGRGDWMGWVRRIMVNTCIDHLRKQAKFNHQPLEIVSGDNNAIDPDIYNRLSASDVMRLLQELPRNTALVFNLFVLDGFKHEEIGQMLGIAIGTSKWHLNEARRLLKHKLDTLLKKEIYSNAI